MNHRGGCLAVIVGMTCNSDVEIQRRRRRKQLGKLGVTALIAFSSLYGCSALYIERPFQALLHGVLDTELLKAHVLNKQTATGT